MLIDEEGDQSNDQAFQKIEGGVKKPKAGIDITDKGKDCLICRENRILGHEIIVDGICNQKIDGNREHAHGNSSREATDKSPCARFMKAVDHTCRTDKRGGEQEIGKLANAPRVGHGEVQNVFY